VKAGITGKHLPAPIKIFLYVLFVISLFIIKAPGVLAVLTLAVSPLLLAVPFRFVRQGWVPISILLMFTFLSNVFFHQGKVLFHSGMLIITEEGFTIAAVRTLRVFLMIMGAKIVIGTTSIESLVAAMGRMFRPLERFGLPVGEFFSTMGLVMKSLPKLTKEIAVVYREKMKEENVSGFWNRIRTAAMVFSGLFVQGLESPEKFLNDKSENTHDG
jgi:energy-coupling factor transport system permease protein